MRDDMDMEETVEVHINGVPADLWASAKAAAAIERMTLREYVILLLSKATGVNGYSLQGLDFMERILKRRHPELNRDENRTPFVP